MHALQHFESVFDNDPVCAAASLIHILSKMFRGGDLLADRVFEVLTVVFA